MTSAPGPFWVGGLPVTQGSGQIRTTRDGRPFLAPDHSAALRRWRKAIATIASTAIPHQFGKAVPVWVRLDFYLPPPATVRRPYPSTRSSGDVDKLVRAVLDGLTGPAFVDDAQVVALTATKNYRSGGAGVRIGVGPMQDELDLPAGEGT